MILMQQVSTRPSFFEVYAAHHLNAALRPAVRFVLEVLSVRHPRLIHFANRSEEIFTAILLLLEAHHLNRHSALLAESFYALRRSSEQNFVLDTPDKPLSALATTVTLVLSVILPYTRVKLDEWYADATGGAAASLFPEGYDFTQRDEQSTQVSPQPRSGSAIQSQRLRQLPCPWLLRRLLRYPRSALRLFKQIRRYLQNPNFRAKALKWYPCMCAVIDIFNLLLHVLYLYGHSRFFSLSLAIQGLVLRRTTADDQVQLSASSAPQNSGDERSSLLSLLASTADRTLGVLKVSFFAAIFAFRFLQYFYAAEASAPRESGPVIPPPDIVEPASGIDPEFAKASGRCPLCHHTRTSPTACITSGYVFCYLCIVNHIQRTQKCPVTLAPTTVDDLVRVYDDNGMT